MKAADFRASLRADKSQAWMALIGVCVALSPANTKIAGAAWLFICLAGAMAAWRSSDQSTPASDDCVIGASRIWLVSCAVAALLATGLALYWPDGPDSLHAEYRLLTAAAAVWVMVRREDRAAHWRSLMLPAVAVACVTALLKVAVTPDRLFLPSNALPWSVGVAFLVCILLPRLLDDPALAMGRRWYALALAAGLAAVLMSQSRGAYGVLIWCLWLAATAWRQSHAQVRIGKAAVAGVAAVLLLGATAWLPADPLRLRQAVSEVAQAQSRGDYNSSMGARVYVWSLAWQAFVQSPVIGIGGQQRLARIHAAGTDLPAAQQDQLKVVRGLGHVHNQYLHAAMDGGLVGLAAVLAVLVGLAGAAIRLHRVDPTASRQVQGLLFMHVTAGLTNVNMAHNYYAVMLALAVSLVLLGAQRRIGPQDAGPGTGR